MPDKENLKDKNSFVKQNTFEVFQKNGTFPTKRDNLLLQDKAGRVNGKKEAPKLPPQISNPVMGTNMHNYAKKLMGQSGKAEEPKESSVPQKKSFTGSFAKPSLLNNYLSRDKELRQNSRPKQKKEVEAHPPAPTKRPLGEPLVNSKSILQLSNLPQKIQSILNPIKKAALKNREANDVSSISNISDISELSKGNKQYEAKSKEANHFKSTDKNNVYNFNKKEKTFFASKLEVKSKLLQKNNYTSLNKSRLNNSNSSAEKTPEKIEKNPLQTIEKPMAGPNNLLLNNIAFKNKENSTTVLNNSKNGRVKKEKLMCLENLIVKNNESISLKNHEQLGTEGSFLWKGLGKKKELTVEEELANFVQQNHDGLYSSETLTFMIQAEAEYSPNPYYMEKNQNELKWTMRAVLLDWLIEVSANYTFKISTFHYAVNYIDRYLSVVPNVQKSNFQLIGLTALVLATKLEELVVLSLSDFAVSASNVFSVETIKKMERIMLKVSPF